MRFEYVPYEGNWLPIVPVAFAYGKRRLPRIDALVDTGATHTILPLEIASELGIDVDLESGIETQVAGGGRCLIHPSPAAVQYSVREPAGRLDWAWSGQVFFALGQRMVLLGHHQCLERFDLAFRGPEKTLELTPRFRTGSVGRPKRR